MRNKETYELTLTGKLEALPLPNLEDSIWSRIEAQLDIDMPTDDGGGNTPAPAPKSPINFGWYGGAGLFSITAVLISLFMLTQSKDRGVSTTTTSEEVSTTQVDSVSDKPRSQTAPSARSPNSVSPNISNNNSNGPITPVDSNVTSNVVLPPVLRDSPQAQPPPTVALSPQKDSVPGKRSRGVKGITDSDYRIVPKKDST